MTSLIILFSSILLVTMLGIQSLSINNNLRWAASINSFMISLAQLVMLKVMPGPTSHLDVFCYLIGGPIGVQITLWIFPKVKTFFNKDRGVS